MNTSHPVLLPEPKTLSSAKGLWRIPQRPIVAFNKWTLAATAADVRDILPSARVAATGDKRTADITLQEVSLRRAGEYSLSVRPAGVTVAGAGAAAVFHGLQTFRQLLVQYPEAMPALTIHDWPDLPNRGVYYDVCRGRVPRLERLLELAEILAQHKINHLQLYIEHTFLFRGHPDIGRNASPLTAEDILTLDTRCRRLHIELVPSLACFGHLTTVLNHPRYRHLAEDWGADRYLDPAAATRLDWQRRKGWSLAPANPEVYDFLDSLFAEFLPLFTSRQFNVCCDETWDLGMGQSYELCKKIGKGRLYLNHILKLRGLAAKYGKRIMFWGDIIRHHPELIPKIPGDVTVLDWNYWSKHNFATIADFRKAGLPFYACPGTSSWISLFPRLHEGADNIRGFAVAAMEEGATGLLNTDWGDGGHHNFMEFSWHGYLLGAEQGWNTGADLATFTRRFCAEFLKCTDPAMEKAVIRLGDISHLSAVRYQSAWYHIFYATDDSELLKPIVRKGSVCRNGRIRYDAPIRLDAALGQRTLSELKTIRRVFAAAQKRPGCDPHRVLDYWVFAVDTTIIAARKLTVLGAGGRDTPAARRRLVSGMRRLKRRFRALWLARNRPSEIRIMLAKYDRAIAALR